MAVLSKKSTGIAGSRSTNNHGNRNCPNLLQEVKGKNGMHVWKR